VFATGTLNVSVTFAMKPFWSIVFSVKTSVLAVCDVTV
jgi:hypothetical protein